MFENNYLNDKKDITKLIHYHALHILKLILLIFLLIIYQLIQHSKIIQKQSIKIMHYNQISNRSNNNNFKKQSQQPQPLSKINIENHDIRQPIGMSHNHNNNKNMNNSSYLRNFKKSNQFKMIGDSYQSIESLNNNSNKQHKIYEYEQQKTNNKQHHIHNYLNETDNSMQEMLNSSINQFQRFLLQQNNNNNNQQQNQSSLQEQNSYLRSTLNKLKHILREKLQSALKRQKQQLSKMLEDYISLITKLLQDKEQLTITIHDVQSKYEQLEEKLKDKYQQRLKSQLLERQVQINQAKSQIDQFLQAINQYQQEANQQNEKYEAMRARIEQLQKAQQDRKYDLSQNNSIKLQAQSTKIQTLLQLLQNAQEQNYRLREQLKNSQDKDSKNIKQYYQTKMTELEHEHEQQFIEYEKAIKQTLRKKDECIERLNLIIEGFRNKNRNVVTH